MEYTPSNFPEVRIMYTILNDGEIQIDDILIHSMVISEGLFTYLLDHLGDEWVSIIKRELKEG